MYRYIYKCRQEKYNSIKFKGKKYKWFSRSTNFVYYSVHFEGHGFWRKNMSIINNMICTFLSAPFPFVSSSGTDSQKMPIANDSEITEFILLGLTGRPELQPLLFVLFLVVYLVTLLGNLGMIALIRLDSRLHTPMYFFLTNLAFVDLCYSSNATPQMLTNFLSEKKTITFAGCFTQCYIFIALLLTELYMLAAMAYDRYVAICNPLRYSVKMSRRVCICLATFPYVYGFSDGLLQAILTFRLTFCRSNVINHFYCADPPLIKLSCSDTYVKEHAMLISAGFNLSSSLTIILVSYAFIIAAILRIKSAEGRHKAFSTCASHMMAVTLFYGTLFCMYVRPPTDKTVEESKIIAVFYTFVSPVLNPLIYSLRNKDVKRALKNVLRRNKVTKMAMPPLSNKPYL